jgi:hypothetical protein
LYTTSPDDDKLQKSKSIDGCLKHFFRKKIYVKKQFENFMLQQHVLFQSVAKLAEQS